MASQPDDRVAALARLRAEAQATSDPLGRMTRFVFGDGNPRASLVLVGEAPGADEDRLGKPFVGAAGRLLDRALTTAGVDRSELWVTNLVKHRPTVAGTGNRLRNRPPDKAEIAADRPWLDAELSIILPRVVVCLGAVAASALVGPSFRLGESRGKPVRGGGGWTIIATYHPSYPLRLVGETFDRVFGAIVDDLRRARELAESPIEP